MADSYHIIDGQVVPFHGGRKDTNTGAWRDATPLELQLQEQLAAAEEALAEAAAALEAAREDATSPVRILIDAIESEIRQLEGKSNWMSQAARIASLRAAIDQARGKGGAGK